MTAIAWTADLSVGIVQIDEQHQELLGLLNELADAISVGKGRDALERILAGLIKYTVEHFSYEEDMLRTRGYPAVDDHKREHEAFIHHLDELCKRMSRGATASLSMEVLGFLVSWLTTHIRSSDKRYSTYLDSREAD